MLKKHYHYPIQTHQQYIKHHHAEQKKYFQIYNPSYQFQKQHLTDRNRHLHHWHQGMFDDN